jgi:hypothetical protein
MVSLRQTIRAARAFRAVGLAAFDPAKRGLKAGLRCLALFYRRTIRRTIRAACTWRGRTVGYWPREAQFESGAQALGPN